MRKFLLLFAFIALSLTASAWNNGDQFTVGGVTYKVGNVSNFTVGIYAIDNSVVVNGNEFRPSATVTDPRDSNVKFKVTRISLQRMPSAITKCYVPEGVTYISFSGGSQVAVECPSTLTEFYYNSNVSEISFPNGNSTFKVENDALLSADGKTFYYKTKKIPADGVYTIPSSVETLSAGSFNYISNLKKIILPANLKNLPEYESWLLSPSVESIEFASTNTNFTIKDGVLYKNETDGTLSLVVIPPALNITEYTAPDNCKKVFRGASKNKYITKINLNKVSTLSDGAIANMIKLTEITIPACLTDFTSAKVSNCAKLATINIETGHPTLSSKDGVIFNAEGTTLILMPSGRTGEYVVPKETTTIEGYAFRPSNLTKLSFESGSQMEMIGERAFHSSVITNFDFSNITKPLTLGVSVFSYNLYLKEITLPKTLTELPTDALRYCTALETVIIPEGSALSSIGPSVFLNLPKLTTVQIPDDCPLTSIGGSAFSGCKLLQNVNIPSTVESLGNRAFSGCESLTEFTLPASLTTIGASTFSGCTNLTTINFPTPSLITTIGRNAFDGVGLTSVTLTEGITKVDAEAFIGCTSLTEINIPKSLTNLSPEAFKFCSNLTTINVNSENANYTSVDGILLSKDMKTVMLFPAGKADMGYTLLPPTVTKIGDYAFYCNPNLTNITLPQNVTTIGKRAFGLCENLTSITFLSNTKMDASGICTEENLNAFDDGALDDINLVVREGLESQYASDTYYQGAKGVKTSAKVDTEDYLPMSDVAVMMLGTSSTDEVFVVPSKVTIGSTEYEVELVGDYCFNGASTNIKEVVLPSNVTYVGAQAFKDCPTIENIYFLSNTASLASKRYNLASTYNEFTSTQKIYVKRSKLDEFKTNLSTFASNISYEIPYSGSSAEFGSFCREFATDFSNAGANTASAPKYIAFTSVSGPKKSTDDEGNEIDILELHSINEGSTGDGTFIPANTGVIFRTYPGESVPTFYEIADNQSAAAINGCVKVALTAKSIQSSGSTHCYYIGKNDGKAHEATSAVSIPAHKAYIEITSSGAKALAFSFANPDGTTAIQQITNYELQGTKNGKCIENGALVIYKNGVKYNLAGQVIQ